MLSTNFSLSRPASLSLSPRPESALIWPKAPTRAAAGALSSSMIPAMPGSALSTSVTALAAIRSGAMAGDCQRDRASRRWVRKAGVVRRTAYSAGVTSCRASTLAAGSIRIASSSAILISRPSSSDIMRGVPAGLPNLPGSV
jgi:hypothetical protein